MQRITEADTHTYAHSQTQKCHNCETNAVEDEVFQYVKFGKQRLECFREIRTNEEVDLNKNCQQHLSQSFKP